MPREPGATAGTVDVGGTLVGVAVGLGGPVVAVGVADELLGELAVSIDDGVVTALDESSRPRTR